MEHQAHPQEQAHPQPLEYVKIAVVLAIVTAVEVGLYFTPSEVTVVRAALVPTLLVLSAFPGVHPEIGPGSGCPLPQNP